MRMIGPVDRAVRAMVRRNSYTLVWRQGEECPAVELRGKRVHVRVWAPRACERNGVDERGSAVNRRPGATVPD
jgi:hypothetical protein